MSSTTVSPTPALAGRRVRVPHVWWIHEFTTLDHGKRYALGERMSQWAMGALSELVAINTKVVADHYSPPIPGAKVAVVELGVEPIPVSENAPRREQLNALLLGRKARAKGCETAIRAVATLRQEDDIAIRLRMVGPALADYAKTLWYLARDLDVLDCVEFVEYAPDPREHMEWCNVVLVPSYHEAFGRVTIEALKSGRPVIGARAGATVDLITNECNGLLFEPGDAGGLAAAIRRTALEPELLERMAKQAQATTDGRFMMEHEVETFVTMFQGLKRT